MDRGAIGLPLGLPANGLHARLPRWRPWLGSCTGKLVTFELPKAAVVVDEIPRNPSGKNFKSALREQFKDSARAPE